MQPRIIRFFDGAVASQQGGFITQINDTNPPAPLTVGQVIHWLKTPRGYVNWRVDYIQQVDDLVRDVFITNFGFLASLPEAVQPPVANVEGPVATLPSTVNSGRIKITDKTGASVIIENLAKWCRENNVAPGSMYKVLRGDLKQVKGFKAERI